MGLSAPHELNDFDLCLGRDLGFRPLGLLYNQAVEFNGDPVGPQAKVFE
jgi:hypothetical protein